MIIIITAVPKTAIAYSTKNDATPARPRSRDPQ